MQGNGGLILTGTMILKGQWPDFSTIEFNCNEMLCTLYNILYIYLLSNLDIVKLKGPGRKESEERFTLLNEHIVEGGFLDMNQNSPIKFVQKERIIL